MTTIKQFKLGVIPDKSESIQKKTPWYTHLWPICVNFCVIWSLAISCLIGNHTTSFYFSLWKGGHNKHGRIHSHFKTGGFQTQDKGWRVLTIFPHSNTFIVQRGGFPTPEPFAPLPRGGGPATSLTHYIKVVVLNNGITLLYLSRQLELI